MGQPAEIYQHPSASVTALQATGPFPASHRGIPYTRLIREIMEREIARPER